MPKTNTAPQMSPHIKGVCDMMKSAVRDYEWNGAEVGRMDKFTQEINESWTVIDGFENYMVSNHGRVYSNYSGKHLKPVPHKNGYLYVALYSDGKQKVKTIHRLVATHFVDGAFEGSVINHRDADKHNNHYENLEWCSQKHNIMHSHDRGLQNPSVGAKNPLSKRVAQYSLDGKLIKIWDAVMDAERATGITSGQISQNALGKCKTAKGFVWKYIAGGA